MIINILLSTANLRGRQCSTEKNCVDYIAGAGVCINSRKLEMLEKLGLRDIVFTLSYLANSLSLYLQYKIKVVYLKRLRVKTVSEKDSPFRS